MATKSLPGSSSTARRLIVHVATPEFISPDLWPPNWPDLNSVERVYQKRVRDVDDFKQRLVEV